MDDTGIEPVTPTMSMSSYAVLRVPGSSLSRGIKRRLSLEVPVVISSYLKGVRKLLGVFSGTNATASTPMILFHLAFTGESPPEAVRLALINCRGIVEL